MNTVVAEMAAWLSQVVTEQNPHPAMTFYANRQSLQLIYGRPGVVGINYRDKDGSFHRCEWDLNAGPAPAKLLEWMEHFKLQAGGES